MRSIGFRVEPSAIIYAVVDGTVDKAKVVTTGKLPAPATYDDGDALVWYREKVCAALRDHDVKCMGIRFPEAGNRSAGTGSSMKRLRIEGVVMEATRSMSIPITAAGALQHIRGKLESTHSAKSYFVPGAELRTIKLDDFAKAYTEPILVAVAALGGSK